MISQTDYQKTLLDQAAERAAAPSTYLRPALYPDVDMWCAFYGVNPKEGISGFGETPKAAMIAFDQNFTNQTIQDKKESGDLELCKQRDLSAKEKIILFIKCLTPEVVATFDINELSEEMGSLAAAIHFVDKCTPGEWTWERDGYTITFSFY